MRTTIQLICWCLGYLTIVINVLVSCSLVDTSEPTHSSSPLPTIHPTITTKIITNWNSITPCHQVLEYVHTEYSTHYFELFQWILSNRVDCFNKNVKQVNSHLQDGLNEILPQFSNNIVKDLFHLSIANRVYFPAVQAHYNYYRKNITNSIDKYNMNCQSWVEYNKQQYCTVEQLLNAPRSMKASKVLPIDHVLDYSTSLNQEKISWIMYIDFTDKSTLSLYTHFIAKAKELQETIILRYKPTVIEKNSSLSFLSGYGVELAIKNTEYKVVDDAQEETNNPDTLFGISRPIIKKLEPKEIKRIFFNLKNLSKYWD
jgi:UDP-glucose:glycoprotein glucosyltransferase